ASSMLYSQGENNRVWPHWALAAPTEAPASRTTGVRPRSRTWAAAASPTGPAPIMITGSRSDGGVPVALGMGGLLKNGGDRRGWAPWARAAPTEARACRPTGVRPRSRTWAAAASPTGPAPIMITGSRSDGGVSEVLGMGGLLKNGGDRGG